MTLRERCNSSRQLPINVIDEKWGEHFGRAVERERRRIAPSSKAAWYSGNMFSTTAGWLTRTLTCAKSVSVWKGEQGCFIGNAG